MSGVPRGSVLTPLIFLLSINDLTNVFVVKVRLLADHCMLYHKIKTVDDQIKLDKALNRIEEWRREWSMMNNPDKIASKVSFEIEVYSQFSLRVRKHSPEKCYTVKIVDDYYIF